jgi:DNA-binding NarL/FixJ family response regulator
MAAAFFVGDVIADLTFDGFDAHLILAAVVSLALVLGLFFGIREVRRTLESAQRSEEALAVAKGALVEVMESYFDAWQLTSAERDVAMLALKGCDINEISTLRGVAHGTVRAQLSRVYSKSGVSNRTELISIFIEDLMDQAVIDADQRGTTVPKDALENRPSE